MNPIRPIQSVHPHLRAARKPRDLADLSDAVARLRADEVAALATSESDLTNVVPFPRGGRQDDEQALPRIVVTPADRSALAPASARQRLRWTVCLLCSMAAHAALYLPFEREPDPMASIGLEAITVDIVLGADQAAGVAAQPTESEGPASNPITEPPKVEPEIAQDQPAESKQTQEEPKPVEAVAVEPTVEPPPAERPPNMQAEERAPTSAESQQIAALPMPREPAPLPAELQPGPSTPEAVREPPPKPAPLEPPKETAKPPPKKPQPKVAEPPRQQAPAPKRDTRQAKPTNTDLRSRNAAASAASGVGRGSSTANSNYRGLVAAHLARFKQFPADARARGEQGSAIVTFMLDGSGRVTAVSLSRGAGTASLDREAVAMVRRASPFPAPPDGRALSFTAPVSFRLQ